MAKIEWIERRLENWARWRLKRSGHALGFPKQNVLARFWQPPRYREAVAILPVDEAEAWTMEQCIGGLPAILKDTVEQRYLTTGTVTDDAKALRCGVSTVHARIEDAHRLLAEALNARRGGVASLGLGN